MTDNYIPATGEKLKSQCTLCGNCCKNHIISTTIEKASEISEKTGRSANSLFFKFSETPQTGPWYFSLRRKWTAEGLECIFLKDNKCELHSIDPELKPDNCKHVPYNLLQEEDIDWTDAKKKKCKYSAKIGEGKIDVYFGVMDNCPGVGQGEKIDTENLKKEMAKDEEALMRTSEAILRNVVVVTENDKKIVKWGKAMLTGIGKYCKGKKFSYLICPINLTEKINEQKIVDCINFDVENHNINKDAVFRFSIVEGQEKGMLLGVLGEVEEEVLKK